jgi:hypothetical protein
MLGLVCGGAVVGLGWEGGEGQVLIEKGDD